jgi:membrane protein DedA with SNARE-associated domain/membrane-associated phospholipid phosphatase
MFDINVQPLIAYLHTHPHSAGLITFFVVFCEAMAVIGVIVPGTITMTAIGMLIGSAVIPMGATLLWGIAGAIIGDYLSYLIGVYYKNRLHRIWPFRKHPQLLERSEKFFHDHGGKSIFIGRFVGPMRAMIPMVAGMLKMSQVRFLFAAIPSVTLWTICYMMPGILLGALSLELPAKTATTFALTMLGVIIGGWVAIWFAHHFFKRVCQFVDLLIKYVWIFMRRYVVTRWFTVILSDPREPNNHAQLTRLFALIVSTTLFGVILFNVITHGMLTAINAPLYHLLSSLRTVYLDHIMVAITLLGDNKVLIISGFLLLVWLIYKRYWYIAVHWLALLALCAATLHQLKLFIYSARPEAIAAILTESSFPSGHTSLAVTVYGFLAVVIARELSKKLRNTPYIMASIIISLVAFSRLYLGAHWITDILGGIFFGISLVLLLTISYCRRHTQHFSTKLFTITAASIFTVVWLCYSLLVFNKEMQIYKLSWPMVNVSIQDWQAQKGNITYYRDNRLGNPIQPLNIQWLGTLDDIRQSLLKKGWAEQSVKLDPINIIRSFAATSITHHFPLFPLLYHNRRVSLLMTKETQEENAILILRLWQADLVISDSNLPLWLGTIEYHRASPKIFSLHQLRDKTFIGATDYLASYLNNFAMYQITYHSVTQPPQLQDLHWDGKLLLIRPKKNFQPTINRSIKHEIL